MPFQFEPQIIPELILIKAEVFPDDRGFFMETYKASVFTAGGIPGRFVQDNLSYSKKGVLRGLHYQLEPMAQGKLVGCLSGKIFDVAVDIRQGSPTHGRWVGAYLSADNRQMLWVPEGFAHGFQVVSEEALVLYKVTKEFSAAHDSGIAYDDPALGIQWPLPNAIVSAKDAALKTLEATQPGFVYRP